LCDTWSLPAVGDREDAAKSPAAPAGQTDAKGEEAVNNEKKESGRVNEASGVGRQ
jgi:hypothetical protein